MLNDTRIGWGIARAAVTAAGGGATAVLDRCARPEHRKALERLTSIGFDVFHLDGPASIVPFAGAFAKCRYGAPARGRS